MKRMGCGAIGLVAMMMMVGLAPPSFAAAPGNLDELLQQTRSAREREAEANKAREAKFLAERNQQAQLLADARREKGEAEARSKQLSASFDANEKKLAEMEETLAARAGNLGEMFGVVRQTANDYSSVLHNSIITAQFPEREAFVTRLSQTKGLPSIQDLERLWFEMQREMTESGKVVKFTSKVVTADGERDETVVRVGPFVALNDDGFLAYLAGQKQFAVMGRQPGSDHVGRASALLGASGGYTEMTVDPNRGVILALYTQRPTWRERIDQGELVGYIIIVVGLAGAALAIFQFLYLLKVSAGVRRQLARVNQPSTDNPLGRVLATFKGDAAKAEEAADVVELRISEAVLREVPPLERFQAFLRLAVAAGPLLGLVGTVIGMIITFQSITESGSGDPRLMAAGISQAMIATVLGLGIAIPLLFMNAALQSMSRKIVQILDEQSTGLLAERLEAGRSA
ncbi:MAG: MotA/TolQ/ExbB proton channel family protein [Panacagrimonas sp.]